jgi:archaeal type IV pilus assembly protein PilA
MMPKIWKNRSAVSPVIATILMVAITVVLAAVLYVMVMGMGTGGSIPQAPVVSLSSERSDRVVVSISYPTTINDIKFNFGGDVVDMSTADRSATANGLTVTFVDAGADGKVTSNDYFEISGIKTSPTASITLTILWVNADTTQSLNTIVI